MFFDDFNAVIWFWSALMPCKYLLLNLSKFPGPLCHPLAVWPGFLSERLPK
jgi:hypothetical protein